MLALVMRKWFFIVLPYLWFSRRLIVRRAAARTKKSTGNASRAGRVLGGSGEAQGVKRVKPVTERVRVKLVAMPFLDSVMDGIVAFEFGLVLTLVEFIVCVVIYHLYSHDDVPSNVRLVLTVVAICCMVGKCGLAVVAIFPLRADEDGPGFFGSAVVGDRGDRSSLEGGVTESGASVPREEEGPVRW